MTTYSGVPHCSGKRCIPLLSLSEILTRFRHYSQRYLTRESGFDPYFSESDRRGVCGARVEVIKRSDTGFEVLPRRWVVERTFSWLVSSRRLSLDYEHLPEVSEAMIYASMVRLMLRRLAS